MKKSRFFRVQLVSLLFIPFLFLGSFSAVVTAATSVELQSQLNNIQAQIAAGNQKARDLAAQADSLRKAIAQLDAQIEQQNILITQTNVKIADLQDKLVKTQAELDRQKDLLKDSIRALYKKGGASTVELLIGSDSFSQFIDSQEYFNRLKSAIQESTNKVIALKLDLQSQQQEQEILLKQQQDQKASVEATRGSRQGLLEQTQGDEARYKALVASLRQQQIDVNQKLIAQIRLERGDGNNGGYPYDNYAFSMLPFGCGPGEGPDRWGYCTRQCVSYAAWAVERSGRQAPLYYGNAKDWIWHAQNNGVAVDRNAKSGDVVIFPGGSFGHAAYVEAVYGDGTMRVSQYNIGLDGRYSEANMSTSAFNAYYLHFP